MQLKGTKAIRTKIPPSKPKREITKITNSQNTKGPLGQPSWQLFPRRWLLNDPNQTKNNMNKHKAKRHRSSVTGLVLLRPVINYWGLICL